MLTSCDDVKFNFDDPVVNYKQFLETWSPKARLCPDLEKYGLQDKLEITSIMTEPILRQSIKLVFMKCTSNCKTPD